jgi:signal peptidase I
MENTIITNKYNRQPWIAAALSLIMPGLGHIYAGKIVKALVLMFLISLCYPFMLFALAAEHSGIRLLIIGIAIAAASLVQLVAIIDSCYVAKYAGSNYALKDYNRWYVYVLLLLTATAGNAFIGDVFYFREKCAEAFRIPTWTMYPAIHAGDRVLTNKMVYNNKDPKRGDVVVFRNPDNRQINFIKRVVAVAGDTVEIKDSELYVNGNKLELRKITESALSITPSLLHGDTFYEINGDTQYKIFLGEQQNGITETLKNFGPITIPKHEVFVLGDNRNSSYDSRNFGPIPIVGIKGKATYLYWSAKLWRFEKIE